MSQWLVVLLDPSVGIDSAGLAAAWNADETTAAVGSARVAADRGEFIPGAVEMVVVPLAVNLASSAAYDLVKKILRGLRRDHEHAREPKVTGARAGSGDLVVMVRTGDTGL